MKFIKKYILPIAIVLGLLLHNVCAQLSFMIPYLIFIILFLTFSAVDLRKIRVKRIDVMLLAYQITMAGGCYLMLTHLHCDKVICEAVMMASLTPVAASSTVVACMLGADRETMTGYSIIGNLGIAVAAPLFFTLIGDHPEYSLGTSFLMMLLKIGSTLALPFFLALLLQMLLPKVNNEVAKRNGWSYYVWAVAFLLTIGQTMHYIIDRWTESWGVILVMGAVAMVFCLGQFILGRQIDPHYGDRVSGAQLMGQKNSAMGIWMCNTFLMPLSSVLMAFYSIFQNLYNSWQLSRVASPPAPLQVERGVDSITSETGRTF